MVSWRKFGVQVSDPWPGEEDTMLWNRLLYSAAKTNMCLYVKLIGLRYAGARLVPDKKFKYRIDTELKPADVQFLLMPHKELLVNLFLNMIER